jgi:uncharacterized protein YdcH (DUF465 family)
MLRQEIKRSEKYKSGYIKTKVEAEDYKIRYCKLLNKWNDLIPDYNKLVDIKKKYNKLFEEYNELEEEATFLDARLNTLNEEIAELKKIKLKDE